MSISANPKPQVDTGRPRRARPKLAMTVDMSASDAFRALPLKERKRIVEEFREACAPAFASVDEYLAEKRRETGREA